MRIKITLPLNNGRAFILQEKINVLKARGGLIAKPHPSTQSAKAVGV